MRLDFYTKKQNSEHLAILSDADQKVHYHQVQLDLQKITTYVEIKLVIADTKFLK